MPRELQAGQRAELYILDVETGDQVLVHSSEELLFEAPNWTSDGDWLILNGGGRLYRIPATGGELTPIDLGDTPPINNDHVVSPDASAIYVSSEDGHLYRVPIAGGEIRRVSNEHEGFTYYLHGISPDGGTLAYIGMQRLADGSVTTNVFTIPAAGGPDTQLTNDTFPDDGSEFSPDGEWIYFNSERASSEAGHAQLFRMPRDGGDVEQLTFDERVNWFPHISPTGGRIAYVSFPTGTLGHPADVDDVIVRLLENGEHRDLATVFGGQGTMNVPSWDPTGTRIAFVAYPIGS
ncbi:MAG: biopolymer transporter Tol [Microbacteriaceae bacterium]|jgi:Tol biopolymer transport system component|nr:biopolymer transporter Tol [Microbacteriaceae bacterium]